jgi:hypothetical protein
MTVGDLFQHRKQLWLRLPEKGRQACTKCLVIPNWRSTRRPGRKQPV